MKLPVLPETFYLQFSKGQKPADPLSMTNVEKHLVSLIYSLWIMEDDLLLPLYLALLSLFFVATKNFVSFPYQDLFRTFILLVLLSL